MDRRFLLPLALALATGTTAYAGGIPDLIVEPVEVEAASSSTTGLVVPNLVLQLLFAAHLEAEAHTDPDTLAIESRIFQRLTAPEQAQSDAAMGNTPGAVSDQDFVMIHCLRDRAIEAMLAGAWDFEADRSLGKGFDLWLDAELAVMQAECRGAEAQSPRG